jgi:hypothetical protein
MRIRLENAYRAMQNMQQPLPTPASQANSPMNPISGSS